MREDNELRKRAMQIVKAVDTRQIGFHNVEDVAMYTVLDCGPNLEILVSFAIFLIRQAELQAGYVYDEC